MKFEGFYHAARIIKGTFTLSKLDEITESIVDNREKYNKEKKNGFEILMKLIEHQRMLLNPYPTRKMCNDIAEIEVIYTKQGNGFLISHTSKTHPLEKFCAEARKNNMNLTDYIMEYLEVGGDELYDITYTYNEEEEYTLEEATSPKEEGIYIGGFEPEKKKEENKEEESTVSIDVASIINKLQNDLNEKFKELAEEIRNQGAAKEIRALKETIDKLRQERDMLKSRYEELENKLEEERNKNVYERFLTSKEYDVFRKYYREELPGLKPFAYHARGEGYEVRIEYTTPEELEAIKKFMSYVKSEGRYKHRMVSPYSRGNLANLLCKKFTEETGNPCGISRTGAIARLAKMISDYIDEQSRIDPSFDSALVEKYIHEMDLFAMPGQKVYTAEQAEEAFGMLMKNIYTYIDEEGMHVEQKPTNYEEFEPEDMCMPSFMYPRFVDIYIYLEKLKRGTATEKDRKEYKDAIEELKLCGYTPEKFGEWLKEAKGFFAQLGHSWEEVTGLGEE